MERKVHLPLHLFGLGVPKGTGKNRATVEPGPVPTVLDLVPFTRVKGMPLFLNENPPRVFRQWLPDSFDYPICNIIFGERALTTDKFQSCPDEGH